MDVHVDKEIRTAANTGNKEADTYKVSTQADAPNAAEQRQAEPRPRPKHKRHSKVRRNKQTKNLSADCTDYTDRKKREEEFLNHRLARIYADY
jgi:hypothetical protein